MVKPSYQHVAPYMAEVYNTSNMAFDKKAYMREYMRKYLKDPIRRAKHLKRLRNRKKK